MDVQGKKTGVRNSDPALGGLFPSAPSVAVVRFLLKFPCSVSLPSSALVRAGFSQARLSFR